MKHNFKLKERLGALLLAMLFYSAGNSGACACLRNSGGTVNCLETWDSDKVVEYGYRFNMKFQPELPHMNLLGVIIWTGKLFQTMEKANDTECVRVGADYKAGSAGMRYNNVGKRWKWKYC